jgi:phage-related baseplate assembly protein
MLVGRSCAGVFCRVTELYLMSGGRSTVPNIMSGKEQDDQLRQAD